jgi:hypothetical protein
MTFKTHKILLLTIIFLSPLTSFADNFPPADAGASKVSGANIMSMSQQHTDTNLAHLAHSNIIQDYSLRLYKEVHAVKNSSRTNVPVFNCTKTSIGKIYIQGSYKATGPDSYTYTCFVGYSDTAYMLQRDVVQARLGFATAKGTVDINKNPSVDIFTLKYPDGWPDTTLTTTPNFSFGSYSLCGESVTLQVNGVASFTKYLKGAFCAPKPYSMVRVAATTAKLAPFASAEIYKVVGGPNIISACRAVYSVTPTDIGKVVPVDCCPSYRQLANTIPSGPQYLTPNQNWGCPGEGCVPAVAIKGQCNQEIRSLN